MAITQNTHTGDGSNLGPFPFDFKWLESTDVKVSVDGALKTAGTHYNLQALNFATKSGGQVLFTTGNAPGANAPIRIYRDTNDSALYSTFVSGSAIRATDLNNNFNQDLYVVQELDNNSVRIDGTNSMIGNLDMGGYKIVNLQSNPTADTDAANKQYVDSKVGASGPPGYTNWSYTAAGGETVVGIIGTVLEYQVGKEQVYLNGALQQRNVDYTANNGSTVTFTPALTAGDVVMVRCVNYLAANPSASYDYSRWTYTATGGETVLSGGTPSLSYTASREQVFLNGALLQRGTDYTATNGTSVTILGSPLISGDMVEVHSNNSI